MITLLLTEVFPPQTGGSGRWLYELYRRLPGCAAVAAGECDGDAEFDRRQALAIERLGLSFPAWGCMSRQGAGNYWRAFAQLMRLMREHQPAAVHCGKVLPEGWLAWMLRLRTGLPYWVYVHGEELNVVAGSRELAWMTRRVLASACGVVANSQNTVRLLADEWRVPAAKLHLLHPGVDAGRFCPAGRDAAVRRRLGWGERPVVLCVGRLQKRKGQDMLVRAVAAIRRQTPDVLVSIVGEGREREAIERLVAELGAAGHVELRGEPCDAELIECYQQCDVFALPNREVDGDFEGFGMVLVEAQGCGKPVIAGDSGGTRETLVEGRTGLVVDCTRPEPLAEAVSGLLLDPERRRRMGEAAREHVASKFDWPQLAARAAQILGIEQPHAAPVAAEIGEPSEAVVA